MEKPAPQPSESQVSEILKQTQSFINQGKTFEGVNYLKNETDKYPENFQLVKELSLLCAQAGRPQDALKYGLIAADLRPEDGLTINNLGSFYEFTMEFEQAYECYKKALGLDPNNIIARGNLSSICEKLNRLDEALEVIEAAPKEQINDPYLVISRARLLRRQKKLDEAAESLYAVQDENIQEARQVIFKYYELIKIEDKRGNYDKTFDHIQTAEKLWCAQSDARLNDEKLILGTIQNIGVLFKPEWISNWTPTPIPKRPPPVQVVGFPRSGTTLIDQILQAHPSIVGMEEKPTVQNTIKHIENITGPFLGNIADLPDQDISSLQDSYFAEAEKFADFNDDQILLDKNPFNIPYLGPMIRLFPNMKTIIMLRHPMDCVLSSLMQLFAVNKGTIFLANAEKAARYYNLVFSLLEQYQTLFPNAGFYEIRYEDLVADPKEEIRYLLEFLELPWDESVLRFYENEDKATVTSASYAQVNQPIYESAMYRWKNYEKHLESVKPILQPWIEKFGYE